MTLWRVRATIDDKPGFLAVLAASLALRSVNILAVQVHTSESGAIDDFLVDAPEQMTERELLAAVERGRGREAWVAPADPHALVDAPARAVDLAAHLVQDPDATGEVLGELLGAHASWQSQETGFGLAGARLRLPAPEGGSWLVTREAPEFTPAEYARAQALLAVPAAMRRGPGGGESRPAGSGVGEGASAGAGRADPVTLLLVDGRELTVRAAGAGDLGAVRALHDRCSPATLQRRYLHGGGVTDLQLRRLLTPARGFCLVAQTAGGLVVAMANLLGEGVQAEAALLIEDGWQHRGLGTALLRRLVRLAAGAGFDAVVVYTAADNEAMLRTLRRLRHGNGDDPVVDSARTERDGGLVTVTLPLGRAAARYPAGPA